MGEVTHDSSKKSSKKSSRLSQSAITDATFGWLGNLTDLSLVALSAFCGLHQAAYSPRRSADQVLEDAGKFWEQLRAKRLQHSLRHGLYHLAKAGYRDGWTVSNEGYRRLKELVPKYLKERRWDGSLYLVAFDIPENLKRSRDDLRKTLQDIGAGMVQKSVWAALVNPEPFLEDVVKWNELEEYVLVSKIGRDGYLAKKGVGEVIKQAFRLARLNERYRSFLAHASQRDLTPMELALVYLGILKNDPQLPFELLPKDWVGDRAFKTYRDSVIPGLPHEQDAFIDALLGQ